MRDKRIRRTLHLVPLLLLVTACSALEGLGEDASPPISARPMPGWEQAFRTADPCWRGADSVSSVPLSDSRILWLFGDTWISPPEAPGRIRATIVRNSLAVQERKGKGVGKLTFFWNTREGESAAFDADAPGAWLWPLSGVRVGGPLALFFLQVEPSGTKPGFAITGSRLLLVSDPDLPPDRWRVRRARVPFFAHGPEGDTFFGSACLLDGDEVFVYGVREDWSRGPEGRVLLVARAPRHALGSADFASWRFACAGEWTRDWRRASPLFAGAAPEMSVSPMPSGRGFVAVYSACGLSPTILLRFAASPRGPWSEPRAAWRCPEATAWNPRYFCYAGKGHPELGHGTQDLVISYAANSTETHDHIRDARLYWPRFVRLTFGSR